MTDSTLRALSQPEPQVTDPLHELLRRGARDLIAKGVKLSSCVWRAVERVAYPVD